MKSILIFLICATASFNAAACDICGCSISNSNPFLFPYLSKNFVSMGYMHRAYNTHPGTASAAKQTIHSILLSGQYSLTKKWQVTGTIPYQVNRSVNENGTANMSGVGDVSMNINYKLLDKITKANRQTITISAGAKLPTGANQSGEVKTTARDFQPGTGSLDYLASAVYRLSYRKWIFSAATSYKYNTQNNAGYRYGDVLTGGGSLVYRKDMDDFSITPYIQVLHETMMNDADRHLLMENSGGRVLYSGGGFDINTNKIAIGINYQFIADQNIANGDIKARPRTTAHISFIL